MLSFTIMTAVMAIGCLAQPFNEKRDVAYVTETEVTYETVWVAPNAAPATPTPTPEVQAAAAPEAETSTPGPAPAPVASPPAAQVNHNHADAHKAAPSAPAPAPPAPAPPAAPAVQAPAPKAPAPAPAAPAAASTGGDSFEAACLDGHKSLRAQHGAGPLSWDDNLAASAQALAVDCQFHHNVDLGPASGYGQNIAMSYGTLGMHDKTAEVTSVIKDSWYTGEEQRFAQLGLYGMSNPSTDFEAWGHFTQEVWKGTTKVGCAVQTCPGKINGYFTVCNYDPAGNYADEYAANVSN